MIVDLANLAARSIHLITGEEDHPSHHYIIGSLTKIPIFIQVMANCFTDMKVYNSEIPKDTSPVALFLGRTGTGKAGGG